jgi:hypothetical protein
MAVPAQKILAKAETRCSSEDVDIRRLLEWQNQVVKPAVELRHIVESPVTRQRLQRMGVPVPEDRSYDFGIWAKLLIGPRVGRGGHPGAIRSQLPYALWCQEIGATGYRLLLYEYWEATVPDAAPSIE